MVSPLNNRDPTKQFNQTLHKSVAILVALWYNGHAQYHRADCRDNERSNTMAKELLKRSELSYKALKQFKGLHLSTNYETIKKYEKSHAK